MWKTEWRAISSRIAGLLEAATYYFTALHGVGRDHVHVCDLLVRNARETFEHLKQFHMQTGAGMPDRARESLTRFLVDFRSTVGNPGGKEGILSMGFAPARPPERREKSSC